MLLHRDEVVLYLISLLESRVAANRMMSCIGGGI
jgi:hypothetical protein